MLEPGDHLICGDDVYGGTNRFLQKCIMGIKVTFVDASITQNVLNALRPNTKVIIMYIQFNCKKISFISI